MKSLVGAVQLSTLLAGAGHKDAEQLLARARKDLSKAVGWSVPTGGDWEKVGLAAPSLEDPPPLSGMAMELEMDPDCGPSYDSDVKYLRADGNCFWRVFTITVKRLTTERAKRLSNPVASAPLEKGSEDEWTSDLITYCGGYRIIHTSIRCGYDVPAPGAGPVPAPPAPVCIPGEPCGQGGGGVGGGGSAIVLPVAIRPDVVSESTRIEALSEEEKEQSLAGVSWAPAKPRYPVRNPELLTEPYGGIVGVSQRCFTVIVETDDGDSAARGSQDPQPVVVSPKARDPVVDPNGVLIFQSLPALFEALYQTDFRGVISGQGLPGVPVFSSPRGFSVEEHVGSQWDGVYPVGAQGRFVGDLIPAHVVLRRAREQEEYLMRVQTAQVMLELGVEMMGYDISLERPISDGGAQEGSWWDYVPVVGSVKSAIGVASAGDVGVWESLKIAGYLALAVSDVFLIKSLATGVARGAFQYTNLAWSTPRGVEPVVKMGYQLSRRVPVDSLGRHMPVHHWLFAQRGKIFGRRLPNWLINQPYNLMPLTRSVVWRGQLLSPQMLNQMMGSSWSWSNAALRLRHGTPLWAYNTAVSAGGHVVLWGSR